MFGKALKFLFSHKFLTTLIISTLAVGGYLTYRSFRGSAGQASYVLGSVEKGTLITTISGSGQISVSNQIDLKAKASGEILKINVVSGQNVKKGQVLVQLDAREAYKAIRDAEANLENAKIALEKTKQPADQLSILQAENSLNQAKEAKIKAEDNLTNGYEDAFNAIASAFLDLPSIVTSLHDILYSKGVDLSEDTIAGDQENILALMNAVAEPDRAGLRSFQNSATSDYQTARLKYDLNFADYKKINRSAEQAAIEALLDQTLAVTKLIAQAAKSESNYLDSWTDYRIKRSERTFLKVTEYQTALASQISQVNNHLTDLLAIQRSLVDNREAIVNADRTIIEKTVSLAKLYAGATPLDIKSQELSVKQKENALLDVKEKLTDYSIRAPFDGVVATLEVKRGDSLSSGGAVATLITSQSLAEISLNEVDAAKIKVGQKATLTFDALENLTLTGSVLEVDSLGAVSQGVVTYQVKIGFDTQDEKIKPGMSVSASVITNTKQDVLLVPNSAVKSLNGDFYVEVPDEEAFVSITGADANGLNLKNPPRRQFVQIGLANDSLTEITEGLAAGEQVIIRTITLTSPATPTSQGQSLFQLPGGNRSINRTSPATGSFR